ncbi:E3 Ubiquitin-Protein Ligase Trip12 [Manis pentadactyla]|nr:E3 Ubiquitin-Protein Ligase Trip12 [Manis pentadactyla]
MRGPECKDPVVLIRMRVGGGRPGRGGAERAHSGPRGLGGRGAESEKDAPPTNERSDCVRAGRAAARRATVGRGRRGGLGARTRPLRTAAGREGGSRTAAAAAAIQGGVPRGGRAAREPESEDQRAGAGRLPGVARPSPPPSPGSGAPIASQSCICRVTTRKRPASLAAHVLTHAGAGCPVPVVEPSQDGTRGVLSTGSFGAAFPDVNGGGLEQGGNLSSHGIIGHGS